MAYCSSEELRRQERYDQCWEGPPRSKRCLFKYNKFQAEEIPGIIICNIATRQHTDELFPIYPAYISREVWGKLIDEFHESPLTDLNEIALKIKGRYLELLYPKKTLDLDK
ncbi:hypothetical protein HY404_04050 [Candidatus Microgenomates bacterium]|nr:hypothetical protein [Candidatus Microgenomates bacterium]